MYESRIARIYESARYQLSKDKPSEWVEKHRVMGPDNPFEGPFRYDRTPYTREIIDCFSPYHPAKIIAVMKGAQIGLSAGVIVPGITWLISENPGNILHLTGKTTLAELGVNKLDQCIDSCGCRQLIRPNTMRKKNSRTGDTNSDKEFAGGNYHSAGVNPKELRQIDAQYLFIDDIDAAREFSKAAGSTTKLIEKRAAAFFYKMKILYASSPELELASIIKKEYIKGDQRKWFIPCECCGVFIDLRWTSNDGQAGMYWKVDKSGKLIPSSVGYVCQECGGFFTDKNKYQFLLDGHYQPTAEPIDENHTSYHVSCLYAPIGMVGWKEYVAEWIEAHPPGQPRIEILFQSFQNLNLGETYEPMASAPEATAIMRNVQGYSRGTIPESLSIKQGNGKIVMLTCGADLNGLMKGTMHDRDDARLDWYVVAHAENGTTYGIDHGSIGTFKPLGGNEEEDKPDSGIQRKVWTYEHNRDNSVWPEFEKILAREFPVDRGGKMTIAIAALDCGAYATNGAYPFLDKTNFREMIGVKGDPEDKWQLFDRNIKLFKIALERPDLYWLQVGMIKDRVAEYMSLRWDANVDQKQPDNFMNFPHAEDGKFEYSGFFEHFESEHRAEVKKDGKREYRWIKKDSSKQNHMWDCFIYNLAARDILVSMYEGSGKDRIQNLSWKEFAAILAAGIK